MRVWVISGSRIVLFLGSVLVPAILPAQQVRMQTPLQHQGASFYESSRIGWSVQNPHYFMRFGGGPATPPFGGASPGAGLQGGFATGGLRMGFGFAQGSSLSSTSTTPVLMTTNGYPGSLFIGSQRPFVTGLAPVVAGGGGPVAPVGPLVSRMAAGEFRVENGRVQAVDDSGLPPAPAQLGPPDLPAPNAPASSATTRPSATAKSNESVADLLKRAEAAEQAGRFGVARIYYQLAATRADAVTRLQIQERLQVLPASSR